VRLFGEDRRLDRRKLGIATRFDRLGKGVMESGMSHGAALAALGRFRNPARHDARRR
jgi:hypothetical protein